MYQCFDIRRDSFCGACSLALVDSVLPSTYRGDNTFLVFGDTWVLFFVTPHFLQNYSPPALHETLAITLVAFTLSRRLNLSREGCLRRRLNDLR